MIRFKPEMARNRVERVSVMSGSLDAIRALIFQNYSPEGGSLRIARYERCRRLWANLTVRVEWFHSRQPGNFFSSEKFRTAERHAPLPSPRRWTELLRSRTPEMPDA